MVLNEKWKRIALLDVERACGSTINTGYMDAEIVHVDDLGDVGIVLFTSPPDRVGIHVGFASPQRGTELVAVEKALQNAGIVLSLSHINIVRFYKGTELTVPLIEQALNDWVKLIRGLINEVLKHT